MKKEKRIYYIFWALMFVGAFLILSQRGYSDGDDVYFYQYTHEMGFFEYLKFRYETWVGRLSGEAMIYVAFRLGLAFWSIVNALMLVLLPMGILQLARLATGVPKTEVYHLNTGITAVSGYLLMSAMTLGYAAVWVNGSIFYTWSFTCGIWALVPVAELVFCGSCDRKKFLYAVPCAILASMSIEQMGAVLMVFEILAVLYCFLWKKQKNWPLLLQTILTVAAVLVLLAAPGNDIRVETETAEWMPEYATMSFGQHLFITVQWLLSSFANENKLFLAAIWIAGIFILLQKKSRTRQDILLTGAAGVFTAATLLPLTGVTVLSDLGMQIADTTVRIDAVPTVAGLTGTNVVALLWWMAALIFTLVFLWRVTGFQPVLLLTYLAGIASEAIMFFSPTMYASGARVYYLTDLLYLFLILALSFHIKKERRQMFCGITVGLGILNFILQIPVFLGQM